MSEGTPTGGALTTVNDILAPRLNHILQEIKKTNLLLAELLGQEPGTPGTPSLDAIIARLPISLADLVYAISATNSAGLVQIAPQRTIAVVNAGLTGQIVYNNPNPSKVIVFLEPLQILSSMYDRLLLVSLTIDDVPHLVNTPLNFVASLEYAKYMVFNRNITLNITNGSANNAVITLNNILALVDGTLYEDKWIGIMQGSYDALTRIAPER